MNILVCGANGFIGRALCARLEAGGHRVVRGVHAGRRAAGPGEIAIDYARDVRPEHWRARL
ncbi:NAD-dependent epimerase/dehydratase family protein, partial [Burkholderia ubonensis]